MQRREGERRNSESTGLREKSKIPASRPSAAKEVSVFPQNANNPALNLNVIRRYYYGSHFGVCRL